jgi:hypothetical protein
MTALKIILAIILGFVTGSMVNMGLVTLGPLLIPLPDGVNPSDMESFKTSAHLLQPRHFVFPFLAHAVGTFVGALIAWWTAPVSIPSKRRVAFAVGVLFLAGGIAACFMIPAPATFIAIDLLFAYLPMAWLASTTGAALTSRT